MFRWKLLLWNRLLRKVFKSLPLVRNARVVTLFAWLRKKLKAWHEQMAEQVEAFFAWLKARHSRPTAKPTLEELIPRIVLSASSTNPLAANAAMMNTATFQVTAAASLIEEARQIQTQVLTTLTHNLQTVLSDWVAVAAYENPMLAAMWQNPSNSSTASQSSGSGSGSGAMSTAHEGDYTSPTVRTAPSQGVSMSPMLSGSGTGSGSGPFVYFGSGSYSVSEPSGSGSVNMATLEVDLSAPSSQTVTVYYSIGGGTAVPGTDYLLADPIRLSFQPGETRKDVGVGILDDGHSDESAGGEYLYANVFGPTNASLGTPSTAVVNILEDSGSGSGSGSASVSGEVWQDSNHDGLLNNGESGLAGVTVYLDNTQGIQLRSTTTDANGNYQFTVPVGSGTGSGSGYEIQVAIPSDKFATLEGVSGSGINSNINGQGYSDPFFLARGDNWLINGGLVPKTGSVSGEVWLDSDGDGILDNGESGMPGITVNLDDPQGQVLMTTTTDANGNYQFTIPASMFNSGSGSGSYFAFKIQVIIPNSEVATIENATGLGTLSEINGYGYSDVYNLPVGDNALVNAGLAPEPVVSGEVWLDNDGDGLLDNSDSGLADVTVNLDDAQGNMLLTTTTDANGNYQFSVSQSILNQASGSGAGSGFEIQVVIPANDTATRENVSGSGINSNINAQGDSDVFFLTPAGTKTVNGGLVPPAVVNGEVWLDGDGDGLLDNGEAGMPGVAVNLDNASGVSLLSTVTDANGNYQFTVPASLLNLGSGSGSGGGFEIQVVLPSGDVATIENASNVGIYSNINAKGYSNIFALTPGGTQQVNAGLVSGSASVSGVVGFDSDGDGLLDNGEAGASGLIVYLDNDQGTRLLSTTTNANGYYQFNIPDSLLNAGIPFEIEVVIPTGDFATVEDAGGMGINSNIDANGFSNVFALAAGGGFVVNAGLLAPSEDTLIWNPQGGSSDASDKANWYDEALRKNGVTAPTATNPVIFDGTAGSATSQNAAIDWTGGVVASMTVRNGYKAQMTIDGDTTMTDNGYLVVDSKSTLNVYFITSSTLQVNDGGTITNMTLTAESPASSAFVLAGGTMTIAHSSADKENLGVSLIVQSGATLWDECQTTLILTSSNLVLTIKGTMQTFYGPSPGMVLIADSANPGNYIDVDGGTLAYEGAKGITDSIQIPVLVENGGSFKVTNSPVKKVAATLRVYDDSNYIFPNGSEESVYMTGGSSTVQLSTGPNAATGTTLGLDDGYYQAEGTLETTDDSDCALIVGNDGTGTAEIAGGTVWIDTWTNSYGELDVEGNLDLDGELFVSIQGYAPNAKAGPSDVLSVSQTLSLQETPTLYVKNYGQLQKTDYWVVIASNRSIQGDFTSESTAPAANLTYGPPNDPIAKRYQITF